MAIEEHVVAQPPWIDALVATVAEAMSPLGFVGHLGYSWWEPDNPYNPYAGWTLTVYPTPNEAAGGPHDGCCFVNGFRLDVLRIIRIFSAIEEVAWTASAAYNEACDGPEFALKGRYGHQQVWLRICQIPPADEAPGFIVNQATGVVREKTHAAG